MTEFIAFLSGFLFGGMLAIALGIKFAATFGEDILDELMKSGKLSKAEAGTLLDRVKARRK